MADALHRAETPCPDENAVQALVEGTASPELVADLERHVDVCSACRARLAMLGQVLASGEVAGRTTRHSARAAPLQLREGAVVGRYTVHREIGSGAMGIVCLAHDPDLDRRIALKLVRTEAAGGGESSRSRVLREAKSNARLAHPNVVAVHDVGTWGDHVFIAMELVEAGTLRTVVGAGKPWRETFALFLEAGAGLAAAHAAGLVHRDFKPDNVLIGVDGRPRVADFGLARAVDESEGPAGFRDVAAGLEATMTETGAVIGTPAYMAPEQMRGERTDARADIFAFCVALFEGLYGQRPFDGRTLLELRSNIEAGHVRQPADRRGVPDALHAALLRGLASLPEDRWESMQALLAALRDGAAPEAPAAAPTPAPLPQRRRGPVALFAAGLVAVVAVGATVAGVSVLRSRGARGGGGSGSGSAGAPPSSALALLPVHPDFAPGVFRRITFDDGCEEFPSFTPDGASVVFDGTDGADSALFLLSLGDLSRRRITRVKGWDFAAAVSPDGTRVAFLRSSGGSGGAYVVPIDATPDVAPHFIVKGGVRPSWSPDGTAVWAGARTSYALHAVDDGHVLRELAVPPGLTAGQSIELSDGRLVASFPFTGDALAGVVGVYSKEGELRRLYEGNVGEVLALIPGPAQHVLAVHKMENLLPALMELSLDGSPAPAIGGEPVLARKGLAVSPDGKRLVYSTCRAVRTLLRFGENGRPDLLSPEPEWDDLDVAALPGSTSTLVVMSERSGVSQPWIIDRNGGSPPRPVDGKGFLLEEVTVSPDGRWLIGMGARNKYDDDAGAGAGKEGTWNGATIGVVVMDVAGEIAPRILTTDVGDGDAVVEASGKTVLFTRRTSSGARQVMRVPFEGGNPEAYLPPGTSAPAPAPDGRVVYLQGEANDALVPMVFDPRARTHTRLSKALGPARYARPSVSSDGKRAVVIRADFEVVELDMASGAILRTLSRETDGISRAVYSGRDIITLRGGWTGDLWTADLAR
jgi:Tol biopolymer transport system component/tRNA A-37 threonylcarbamoyl transferase component Bud32